MTVQRPVQNATLILRVCGTCLNEIAALRREVKLILERIPALPVATNGTAKAVCDSASPISILAPSGASLRALCTIEDSTLCEHLLKAFQAGELSIELHDLVDRIRAQSAGVTLPVLREAILAEFGRGGLQAVVLREGGVESDPRLVQAAIVRELQAFDEESGNSATTIIAISPTFRRPGRSLLEALLRRCEQERLGVPIDLLCKAVCALLAPKGASKEKDFDEVTLLALLNDKLTGTENETLDTTPGGRVFVHGPANALPPFGGDAEKALLDLENMSSSSDAASVKDSLEAVGRHLHTLQAVCGLGSGRAVDGKTASGLLLGLLGTLRVRGAARALGLPQALGESCGAVLLWALEFTLSSKEPAALTAAPPAPAEELPAGQVDKLEMTLLPVEQSGGDYGSREDDPVDTSDCECNGQPTTLLQTPYGSEGQSTAIGSNVLLAMSLGSTPYNSEGTRGAVEHNEDSCPSPVPPSSPLRRAESNVMMTITSSPEVNGSCDVSAVADAPMPTGQLQAVPLCGVGSLANLGAAAAGEDESTAKRHAKTLFVQCFKDDLLQSRHLLLSQINNLYKMRNSGEILPYKTAGYEKLHDFVVSIAGLGLQGSGNRMEVRVVDRVEFEELCEITEDDPDVPVFQKPLPVPESFQHKVVEVFRKMGTREIVAKSFRDVWNRVYPEEKLQVKEFGYRDVRGLLANVPIVDRVGGKYYSKYVLKDDVPLTDVGDMPRTVPTPGICEVPVSAAPQAASWATQAMTSVSHSMENASMKAMDSAGLRWNQRSADSTMTPFNMRLPGASHPVDGFASALALSASAVRPPGIWSDLAPAAPPQRQPWSDPAPAPAPRLLQHQHLQTAPQSIARMPPSAILSSEPAREACMNLPADLSSEVGRTLQDLIGNGRLHPTTLPSPSPGGIAGVGSTLDPAVDPELPAMVAGTLPLGLAGTPPRNPIIGTTPMEAGMELLAGNRSRKPSQELAAEMPTPGLPFLAGRPAPVPLDVVESTDSSDGKKWQSAPPDLTPQAEDPQSVSSSGGEMFRKLRKARRSPKVSTQFVSSPGAFSSQDFDASKHQGKFDMCALFQAELRNDQPALIVDIYNGRVLFTNSLCDCLFEHIVPLPNREIVELIHEDDRIQFSASVMYLNIGKFTYMEPQRMRINSSRGVLWSSFSGAQLTDTWWRVDIGLEGDGATEIDEDKSNTVPNLLSINPVSL